MHRRLPPAVMNSKNCSCPARVPRALDACHPSSKSCTGSHPVVWMRDPTEVWHTPYTQHPHVPFPRLYRDGYDLRIGDPPIRLANFRAILNSWLRIEISPIVISNFVAGREGRETRWLPGLLLDIPVGRHTLSTLAHNISAVPPPLLPPRVSRTLDNWFCQIGFAMMRARSARS